MKKLNEKFKMGGHATVNGNKILAMTIQTFSPWPTSWVYGWAIFQCYRKFAALNLKNQQLDHNFKQQLYYDNIDHHKSLLLDKCS